MKKAILYSSSGIILTLCLTMIWAFRATNDQPTGSYASVNYIINDPVHYAVFAYSDGNPEETKFDKGPSDPQNIVQITNKMEAKGYILEHYAVNSGVGYYFIFHKKP